MFLLHIIDRRTEIEALGLLGLFCFGEHVVPLWGRPPFTRFWLAGGSASFIHVGLLHVCSIRDIHLTKAVSFRWWAGHHVFGLDADTKSSQRRSILEAVHN
jgi:hypothetical protein